MPFKSSIWFDVIDALVEQWREAMSDVLVSDGYGVTNDPGAYLMVGVEDPLSDRAARAVDTDQEWAYANTTTREETGTINCVACAIVGDSDAEDSQRDAREAVRSICDAAADYLRQNVQLGIDEILWTGFRMVAGDQDQTDSGAWALCTFQIQFKAHI